MSLLGRIQKRAQSWWSNKTAWGSWSYLVPSGRRGLSGQNVTPESALSLTAAYAAINVISTDVASLPLKLYRKRRDGGRDEVTDDPRAALMTVSPDGETTSIRFRQAGMGHVLGWGNGYAEIMFDGDGVATKLELLDPGATAPERIPQNKRLFYRTTGGRTIPPYRVLHLAGLGYDGLKGYSPITLAREAVGLGMAAESFGCTFFGNGTWPGLVLESPTKMSKEAIANLREQWEDLHRGSDNSHRVAVLESGLKASRVTISPEDAQFLETRKFQVVEIARLFRLPPHKIGDYSQSHLANIEASNLDYVTTVLMPWCVMIEQECNFKLLTADDRAKGLYFEHNMAALLRGDMRARAEFYAKMRDLAAISPNEIRAKENLNPIDGGDIYLAPMNMAPLSMIEEKSQAEVDKLKKEAEPDPPPQPAVAPAEPGPAPDGAARSQPRVPAGSSAGGQFAGGDSFDSHPDVVDLKKEHAGQIKDLDADYARQRKDLAKDQAAESKALDRDHARQQRELDRDQRREAKQLAKEHDAEIQQTDPEDVADVKATHQIDRESMAESHKGDREALQRDQAAEKQDMASDHAAQRQQLEDAYAEDLAGLKRDHADELAEVVDRLKEDMGDE